MAAEGAKPLFPQEATGIFREKFTQAELSAEDFSTGSGAYMDSLISKPAPTKDQQTVVWELSGKEREQGILKGYYTREDMDRKYGQGKWRALRRHAIQQGQKWRLIDDGKAGEHNATYSSDETIHTTCTAAGVAAAAAFRDEIGRPFAGKWKLTVATQDMKKAYRQIPIHQSQERWTVVMLWHPEWGKWVFAEAKGLLFGLAGAVLAFNRVPAFIVAVARRWLAIPVNSFFDDFRIFDIMKSKGSANRFFKLLLRDVLGWRRDPAKEQPPATAVTFLGNIEDYYPRDDKRKVIQDTMMLRPKEGRVDSIRALVRHHRQERSLRSGDAKTLRSRIIHHAGTCAGRVGKGILHYVNERAAGSSPLWSEELDFNLEFLDIIMALKIHRSISIVRGRKRGLRLWTDASYSIDEAGIPTCKLFAIVQPKEECSKPKGIVLQVPPATLHLFQHRKQQIHMGELLAPLCAVLEWPEMFADTGAIAYIDNMGVLCNIVNGSSRAFDAGTLVFALHLQLARLNSTIWWEWVESDSNCSDGGSRVGICCPLAEHLGIQMVERQFQELPHDFLRLSPRGWEQFWKDNSIQ